MDSLRLFARDWRTGLHWRGDQVLKRKGSDVHATTVAADLARSVFQIAVAGESWRIVDTQRFTRSQFERWFNGYALWRAGQSLRTISVTMRWVTGINMTIAGNAMIHDTIQDFIQLLRKNTLHDSTAIQVLIPATAKVIRNVRMSGITYLP